MTSSYIMTSSKMSKSILFGILLFGVLAQSTYAQTDLRPKSQRRGSGSTSESQIAVRRRPGASFYSAPSQLDDHVGSPWPDTDECHLQIDYLYRLAYDDNWVQGWYPIKYEGHDDWSGYDEAELYIYNNGSAPVNYTWLHSECYKCPVFHMTLQPGEYCSQVVQTAHKNIIVAYFNEWDNVTCPGKFRDKGEYTLMITENRCQLVLLNNPKDPDILWLWVFLFYAGLAVIWVILTFLYRRGVFKVVLAPIRRFIPSEKPQRQQEKQQRPAAVAPTYRPLNATNVYVDPPSQENNNTDNVYNSIRDNNNKLITDNNSTTDNNNTTDNNARNTTIDGEATNKDNEQVKQDGGETANGSAATAAPPTPTSTSVKPAPVKQRLNSLDAFRGLSLTIMIFINYGGAGYWYFEHADWNGLTVGDTVFPWFLWMMGTSMVFSFRGIIKRKTPPLLVVWQIVWRSVKLFAIGLFMSTSWVDLEWIRIPGVLQRFGITYLFAALIYYPFAHKATSDNEHILGDIIFFWPEWLIHAALLAVYLALTFALPVPGCPTGYLGPGGIEQMGWYQNCTGGAAGYADTQMLSEKHMYLWPTCGKVYYTTMPFDPEGFFTVIPTIFLCLLGNQAGKIIVMHKGHVRIIARWFIWAVVTGCLGLLLCEAKQNGGWIPINKNLWSLSYIFAMAATSFLLLAAMYIVIDVLQLWNGAPFIYPGKNSIIIYICHSVFAGYFPVTWSTPGYFVHWESLLLTCWSTSFWLIVAYILHRKRIYFAL